MCISPNAAVSKQLRFLPSSCWPRSVDLAGGGRRPGDEGALEAALHPLPVLLHDAERQLVHCLHRLLRVPEINGRKDAMILSL